MRLIDAEPVLAKMQQECKSCDNRGGAACLSCAGHDFMRAVEESEVLPVRGWIPATERLPESDARVLVCCQTKKGYRGYNLAYFWDGYWHGQGSMAGVTHWMPLPELPDNA